DVLGGAGEDDEPAGDAPGQPPAEQSGADHHGGHEDEGAALERAEQVLGVAELLGDLHRAPAAAQGDGRDPVDVVAHVHVGVLDHLPGRGGPGDPAVGGLHGQARTARVVDLPVRAEDLDVGPRGTDQVVAGGGGGEVQRGHAVVPHLVAQVLHDLPEHGLLVHADQPGGGG